MDRFVKKGEVLRLVRTKTQASHPTKMAKALFFSERGRAGEMRLREEGKIPHKQVDRAFDVTTMLTLRGGSFL